MLNLQFQFHNVNMKGDKRLQLKLEKKTAYTIYIQ